VASSSLRLPDSIQSISEGLAYWAEQTPHAPALRAIAGPALTHATLHRVLAEMADRLSALGIRSDDRVAIVMPSGFEMCLVLLGTIASAIAAPLYSGSTASELNRDLERLSCALVITGGPKATQVSDVARAKGIPFVDASELIPDLQQVGSAADTALPTRGGDEIATILHTSGTTGLPKRVPRPHRTFVAAARIARDSTALTPDDVGLVTSGLHTNSGVANVLASLLNGGTCVIAAALDPAAYPSWLEDYQPTWTVSTASELNLILAADAAGRQPVAGTRSRLRIIRTGAQPMTPGTAERVEQRFRALVMDGFGMTEASYITASGPAATDRREGSCGLPPPGTVRAADETGADVATGAVGEIVIRGPTLFPGYLDDPAANAAAFLPGGWFRTGDVGYLDVDGFLYLTGRINELINRAGEKIAPVEVDRVLLTHPAVAEAAAFAVPDHRLGQDIVVAVVFKPGQRASARALRSWMLDQLSPYKVPRRLWIIDRLPRTATGKVQRGVLGERFLASS
jgi:oxalate---CoA ligase